jgi:hypothetical protein
MNLTSGLCQKQISAPFSPVARAIAVSATAVERVDKLVQIIGRLCGITHPMANRTVASIDAAIARTKVFRRLITRFTRCCEMWD